MALPCGPHVIGTCDLRFLNDETLGKKAPAKKAAQWPLSRSEKRVIEYAPVPRLASRASSCATSMRLNP